MKSSFATAFLLTMVLFASWTPQSAAQETSEEWVSEVSFDSVVDNFGDDVVKALCADDCDSSCGPTWTVAADAVFMQRSRPDSLVLMQDAFDPTRNLNANEFDFDFTAGWDIALERATSNGSLEARFLSIDGWSAATTTPFGPPTIAVTINNVAPFTPTGVMSVDSTYNSELLSAELNLRRQLSDCVNLLGGFRYLELDERFHADLDVGGLVPSTYDTFTRNRLYGVQLGADATLWCRGRLTIDGLAKVGIFHNSAGQETTYDSGSAIFTAADTSDRAAFLGEMAFTANYCLSDRLTLRGGYDLLWLETVALATDQIPATNLGTMAGISADGGAFYHGAFVGLEYRR